jgi:hypothetical protein
VDEETRRSREELSRDIDAFGERLHRRMVTLIEMQRANNRMLEETRVALLRHINMRFRESAAMQRSCFRALRRQIRSLRHRG